MGLEDVDDQREQLILFKKDLLQVIVVTRVEIEHRPNLFSVFVLDKPDGVHVFAMGDKSGPGMG